MNKWDKVREWLVAISLITISMIMTMREVRAAEPTREQVDMTYALVYGLVAHDLGLKRMGEFEPPIVHVVTPDKACEIAGLEKNCVIGGMAIGRDIYVLDTTDWASATETTVLAHEFVHFFQYEALGPTKSWCDHYAREIYAYRIQGDIVFKLPDTTPYKSEVLMHIHYMAAGYRGMELRGGCAK